MNIAILVGRIIVGIFYLYNGINHLIKFGAMTEYAKFKGVPLAEVGVAVSGLLLLVAAFTIILGIFPEIGVVSIVLFFLPVTFMMHNFWAVPQEQQMAEMINFSKNLALMGSALMFLGIKKPWAFSLGKKKGD
ncbi:MAG: DoxX family membrane protein [Candidatus Aminicenantes bacterium]|nr:DoxX family membrane protein [Candidatus Aminicenantes bacterium]